MRFVVAPGGRAGSATPRSRTPKRKAPGFALLGTPGLGGRRPPRAEDRRGCRARRLPVRGQVEPDRRASPPRGRRSPTTRSRRCTRTSASSRRATSATPSPTCPASSRARARARASASSSSATSSAARRSLHVLDCATLEPGRDPLTDLDVILAELAAYPVPEGQMPLLERPQLIALNKVDVPEAQRARRARAPRARGARLPRVRDLDREPRGPAPARLRPRRASSTRHRAVAAADPAPPSASSSARKAVDDAGLHVRVEGGTLRQHLPRARREARALGAADRLQERRGRRLPRRPPREARRRGRAVPRRRGRRARPSSSARATASSSTGSPRSPRPPSSSPPRAAPTPASTTNRAATTQRSAARSTYERMDAKAEARAELEPSARPASGPTTQAPSTTAQTGSRTTRRRVTSVTREPTSPPRGASS